MPAASVLDGQLVDAVEELAVGAVCGTGAQLYIVLHIYIYYITSSHWLHNRMLSANRTMLTYYGTFLVTRSEARFVPSLIAVHTGASSKTILDSCMHARTHLQSP